MEEIMDRQTKKTLNELYKRQKLAKKNFNYYELNEVNKQIFAINEQKEKERKRLLSLERENRLAKRIERRLTEKGLEQ